MYSLETIQRSTFTPPGLHTPVVGTFSTQENTFNACGNGMYGCCRVEGKFRYHQHNRIHSKAKTKALNMANCVGDLNVSSKWFYGLRFRSGTSGYTGSQMENIIFLTSTQKHIK